MRRLALILAIFLLAAPAAASAQRVALVVGVSAYRHVPALANPANDAEDVAAALRRLGFQTDLVLNPDRAQLEQALRRLGQAARGAEAAVFFFAGHALEVAGRNWLLPITADISSERDLRFEAVEMDIVSEQLDGVARLSLVLLDACRDNPFRLRLASGSRSVAGLGLAQLRAAVGTLVAFSTAPGTVAADGSGRNSPFTSALLRRIETPGLELRQMLAEVRRDVREATGGRQVPWEHSALEGAFYFAPPAVAPAATRQGRPDAEIVFWETVRDSRNPAELRAYLARYPRGLFRELAEARLNDISPQPAAMPANRAAGTEPAALSEESLGATLATRMAPEDARRIAAAYVAERGPQKAIAIQPVRRATWRVFGAAEGYDIAELTLERCQIAYGAPCLLVAVNDRLTTGTTVQPMPRVTYQGVFDLAQVPGVPPSRRQASADLARYAAGRGPKAMAVHPTGRFYWRTGAESQAAAEEAALNACNEDRERNHREGPCLLYATGERVVLPERRRTPARE